MLENTGLVHPLKILIIDDNRIIRHLLKVTFSSNKNIELIETDSADNALSMLFKESPNVIILDIMMPGHLDGLALCRLIKSNHDTNHIKVIILSGKDEDSVRQQAKEAGADFYLTKPFSPAKLLALVGDV